MTRRLDFDKVLRAIWYALPEAPFAHGREVCVQPSLSIDGIGTVPLPLSQDDARRIKHVATMVEPALWKLDSANLMPCISQLELLELARFGLQEIGMDASEIGVQVSMQKLLLCEKGGCFKSRKEDEENQNDNFATMLIQLPTQLGHQGGALVVSQSDISMTFNFAQRSHLKYFQVTCFANCVQELEQVTKGTKLCLVYNLLFLKKIVPTEKQNDILFLRALSHVQAEMLPWIKAVETKVQPSLESEGRMRYKLPDHLVIPLAHKYSKDALSIAGLKDQDRIIAALFSNCDLEMNLVILTKTEDEMVDVKYTIHIDHQVVSKKKTKARKTRAAHHFRTGFNIAVQKYANPDSDETLVLPSTHEHNHADTIFHSEPDEIEWYHRFSSDDEHSICIYKVAALVICPKKRRIQVACKTMGFLPALALLKKHGNLDTAEGLQNIRFLIEQVRSKSEYNELLLLCVEQGLREEGLELLRKPVSAGLATAKAVSAFGRDACLVDKLVELHEISYRGKSVGKYLDLVLSLDKLGHNDLVVDVVNKLLSKGKGITTPKAFLVILHVKRHLIFEEEFPENLSFLSSVVSKMKESGMVSRYMAIFIELCSRALKLCHGCKDYECQDVESLANVILWLRKDELVEDLLEKLATSQKLLREMLKKDSFTSMMMAASDAGRRGLKKLIESRFSVLRSPTTEPPTYNYEDYKKEARAVVEARQYNNKRRMAVDPPRQTKRVRKRDCFLEQEVMRLKEGDYRWLHMVHLKRLEEWETEIKERQKEIARLELLRSTLVQLIILLPEIVGFVY